MISASVGVYAIQMNIAKNNHTERYWRAIDGTNGVAYEVHDEFPQRVKKVFTSEFSSNARKFAVLSVVSAPLFGLIPLPAGRAAMVGAGLGFGCALVLAEKTKQKLDNAHNNA